MTSAKSGTAGAGVEQLVVCQTPEGSHPCNSDEVNQTTEKGFHFGHKHQFSANFVVIVVRYVNLNSP